MAITKEIVEDKIEIVGESKSIQVRTATVIKEDGVELSRSYSRHVVYPITSTQNENGDVVHTDTDISNESSEVAKIAGVLWTDEVKAIAKAANEAGFE